MQNRKNVLLIVLDCLRADFVYKSKAIIPNIEKLKNKGFSFLNTITSSSTTTTSFSSLLTGLYPFENGIKVRLGYGLKKDIVTYPEILNKNGYHNYAEITGPLLKEIGLSRGFDEYNYRDSKITIHTKWGSDLIGKFNNHYKKPWFVLLHIWSLHTPRIILNEFKNKKYGNSDYAKAIASIDNYLGKLFHTLDEDTLIILTADHGEQIAHSKFEAWLRNKIVALFSILKRYGLMKMHFAKGVRNFLIGHDYSIYDLLIKIPLIFYNKDIIPSGKSKSQIRQIDIFPTILDLIGIKSDIKLTGESLLPIIEGKDESHRDAYLEAFGISIPNKEDWLAGIRIDNEYKYIYSPFRKDYKDELYFLKNDPQERKNVAQYHPNLIKSFKEKIANIKVKKVIGEKLSEEDQKKISEQLKALGYID